MDINDKCRRKDFCPNPGVCGMRGGCQEPIKEPEIRGIDGTVRKAHYGAGRQPWDDIKDAGWAHFFAAGNVLKYVRRFAAKNGQDDLDKAVWYLTELRKLQHGWTVDFKLGPSMTVTKDMTEFAVSAYRGLVDMLTPPERSLLDSCVLTSAPPKTGNV